MVHRLTTPEEQTALGLGSGQEGLATGQVLVYQDGQEVAEGQVNLPDWWGKGWTMAYIHDLSTRRKGGPRAPDHD
ncbi:hypothetical protein ACW18Z_04780 [Limosilactobacillus fermentum]